MAYKTITVYFRKKRTTSRQYPNGRPPEIHTPADGMTANSRSIHIIQNGEKFSYDHYDVLKVAVNTTA